MEIISSGGRYALTGPVDGGIQFWEINDMQKMFAVVSISATLPFASELAEDAFKKICESEQQGRV